jgi:hypothetical protein
MAAFSARNRFRLEVYCAGVTLLLGVLTLVVPDWIEAVFRVDPDGGDGSLEAWLVVACFAVTGALGTLAVGTYRRLA